MTTAFLTITEVQTILRLKTKQSVYRLVSSGEVKAVFQGGRYLIYKESLDRYLAEKQLKVTGGSLMQGGKVLDKLKI